MMCLCALVLLGCGVKRFSAPTINAVENSIFASSLLAHDATFVAVPAQIVVLKKENMLGLYIFGKLIKTYRVSTGWFSGDKTRQGDLRTPEGEYHISSKRPSERFDLFLGLNYPNQKDAIAGLKSGVISRQEAELIVNTIRMRKEPPRNTRLGGAVGIHGGGVDKKKWWTLGTLGCVRMQTNDVRELANYVEVGTPVLIK